MPLDSDAVISGSFPALEQYLARLHARDGTEATTKLRLDGAGRALGSYFHATLTSAFQPIRLAHSGEIVGYEGFARSYSKHDDGLSIWKLLESSASDDESIELDRLCRMLHAINFYRQAEAGISINKSADNSSAAAPGSGAGADLHLSVSGRLLAAVGSNHGMAFRRILDLLELPHEKIVLQIPIVSGGQGWLLDYVLNNYRRNGFRLAVGAVDAVAALALVETVQADVIKINGRHLSDEDSVARLLLLAARRGIKVAFKCVENPAVADKLRWLAEQTGHAIYAQGYFWDTPLDTLTAPAAIGAQ
ncbi:MAG: diguanylate phosphodiesterase [Herbaspirillum sp.]|nr:diguanylate phosphodiesterase [Herbaspirillum sp.]